MMSQCPFSDIGSHEKKKPKLSLMVGMMMDGLKRAKNIALGSFKHGKTVIDVDRRQECMDLSSDDSSVEEIQVLDSTRTEKAGSSSPMSDEFGIAFHQIFAPLTEDEEIQVFHALSDFNRDKVLVTHDESNIEITGEILQCLRPCGWLNDEVISLYLELLKEREKRESESFLKCHFFNALFYDKLTGGGGGYDFKAVRRWTIQQKIGYNLYECDRVFVPIHKNMHWSLVVINKIEEKFQYLDSLKNKDFEVLENMARYYVDEVKDKNREDIDISSWKLECVDVPTQTNSWDCGVFMIKYADFYSRGLGLFFEQDDMPYFRKRTVNEILRLKAE